MTLRECIKKYPGRAYKRPLHKNGYIIDSDGVFAEIDGIDESVTRTYISGKSLAAKDWIVLPETYLE